VLSSRREKPQRIIINEKLNRYARDLNAASVRKGVTVTIHPGQGNEDCLARGKRRGGEGKESDTTGEEGGREEGVRGGAREGGNQAERVKKGGKPEKRDERGTERGGEESRG